MSSSFSFRRRGPNDVASDEEKPLMEDSNTSPTTPSSKPSLLSPSSSAQFSFPGTNPPIRRVTKISPSTPTSMSSLAGIFDKLDSHRLSSKASQWSIASFLPTNQTTQQQARVSPAQAAEQQQRSLLFRRICFVVTFVVCLFGTFYGWLYLKTMPEINMFVWSSCPTRAYMWDGHGLPNWVPRWVKQRTIDWVKTQREQTSVMPMRESSHRMQTQKLVLVGAHHKTGTFLAKKVYASICGRLDLCCIMLTGNAKETELFETARERDADLVAHWHWSWLPHQVAQNYRFVHFYRLPYAKIASGYRYHKDGVESWSSSPMPYQQACSASLEERCFTSYMCKQCCVNIHQLVQDQGKYHIADASGHHNFLPDGTQLNLYHEDQQPLHTSTSSSKTSKSTSHQLPLLNGQVLPPLTSAQLEKANGFTCRRLGVLGHESLQSGLLDMTPEEGAVTQAAFDFFEVASMAHTVNVTWNDPNVLNMDLDMVMRDFEGSMRTMLAFLGLDHDPTVAKDLADDVAFFDLEGSPLYAFAMSMENHVDSEEGEKEKARVKAELMSNTDLNDVYAPIHELMTGAYERSEKAGMRVLRPKA